MPYVSLTKAAQEFVGNDLRLGDIAVDATAGNGHDTLFLSRAVGVGGKVYGLDLSPAAIDSTARRLEEHGCTNVELIVGNHRDLLALLPENVRGNVKVVMFNLGYLPGSDKTEITQPASTLAAMQAALHLISWDGCVSILAYRGHPGGEEEFQAVHAVVAKLNAQVEWQVMQSPTEPREKQPVHFFVKRRLLGAVP